MESKLKVKGFTLVEVLMVAGIIGLIAAIAVPNMIAFKRTSNEAAAKANLKSFISGIETAYVSLGHYPTTVAELQGSIGAVGDYCADAAGTTTAVQGYNYACTFDLTGYTFVATPVAFGSTGNITYTATTGGILTPP